MRFVKRKAKSTVKKINTLIWNLGALDEFSCKQPVNMQCIEMWRTIHRGQCTSPLFLLDPLYFSDHVKTGMSTKALKN